ncbi:22834_t:CDS:2, partial [Racocetra persica]
HGGKLALYNGIRAEREWKIGLVCGTGSSKERSKETEKNVAAFVMHVVAKGTLLIRVCLWKIETNEKKVKDNSRTLRVKGNIGCMDDEIVGYIHALNSSLKV